MCGWYSKADSPNLLFLCVKLKSSTCFHCFVQEAGGGAQLKWVGVCYYYSGLHSHFPFPSCHTQDFSEHRNSHTGIQADRFQCLLSIMGGVTCGNLKTDEEEVKTVRVRGGQGGEHAECMKHSPINAIIIYEHVSSNEAHACCEMCCVTDEEKQCLCWEEIENTWFSRRHNSPAAPPNCWQRAFPLTVTLRMWSVCFCVCLHGLTSVWHLLLPLSPQLGLAKSLFVNDNTTALYKTLQIVEWMRSTGGQEVGLGSGFLWLHIISI